MVTHKRSQRTYRHTTWTVHTCMLGRGGGGGVLDCCWDAWEACHVSSAIVVYQIICSFINITGLVEFMGNGNLWGLIFTHKSEWGFIISSAPAIHKSPLIPINPTSPDIIILQMWVYVSVVPDWSTRRMSSVPWDLVALGADTAAALLFFYLYRENTREAQEIKVQ